MNVPTKASARHRVRSLRLALSQEQLARRSGMLTSVLQQRIPANSTVAGYLPMRGEPDLQPFLEWHVARAGSVWLPVVPTSGRHLQWSPWTPATPLRRHRRLPLNEPDPERAGSERLETVIDQTAGAFPHEQNRGQLQRIRGLPSPAHLIFLVPALAVDAAGARLGQGGGYYDTSLAMLPGLLPAYPDLRCEVIAVVHSDEVLEPGSFPVQAHDLRVACIATEYRVVDL